LSAKAGSPQRTKTGNFPDRAIQRLQPAKSGEDDHRGVPFLDAMLHGATEPHQKSGRYGNTIARGICSLVEKALVAFAIPSFDVKR